TKTLLNQISINTQTPLISASVNQWQGQIGIFAGYAKNAPCYHCLFPDLPDDARNCNEAGILGTSAGIAGLYQAHVTLCYLLGFDTAKPGTILTFDFKSFRTQTLTLDKDPACPHCQNANHIWASQKQEATMPDLITYDDLKTKDYVIVDVRTAPEITDDPLPKPAIHMELQTVPTRHAELPKDKILAFVCAGNVRSAQAAEYLSGLGYKNVCVLDKFSL
ncbi:MAG: ThiF family adenylyltransferase, partial [Bdellovibrionales bacterium]